MGRFKSDPRVLVEHYNAHKSCIAQRLTAFRQKRSEKELFYELCFCLLTANTSARMAMRVMGSVGDVIFIGSEEEVRTTLQHLRCRFYRTRARYIFLARSVPLQFDREYLVKNIKGLGYKEASHFLRNVGCHDYAILDKHILSSLVEFGVIRRTPRTLTKKQYLLIEKKMRRFSQSVGIPMDELDLVLWSRKTGEVLK